MCPIMGNCDFGGGKCSEVFRNYMAVECLDPYGLLRYNAFLLPLTNLLKLQAEAMCIIPRGSGLGFND